MIFGGRDGGRFGSNRSGTTSRRDRLFQLWSERGFFLFQIRHCHCAAGLKHGRDWYATTLDALANEFRNRLVDGARVRLLLTHSQLREHFEDRMRWNLELPGQLVNADFTHSKLKTLFAPFLTDLL